MSCGITEEELKEQINLKEQIKKLDISRCKRCDGQPYVLLQKKDVFCKLCFKEYCVYKFRSTIGKTKIIKPHHKVLVAYSGGQSSTAMLEMTLSCSKAQNQLQKFHFHSYLIYIDETSVLNCDTKSKDYNNKISEILENYEINKFYSKLEMYFSDKIKFYATNMNDNSLDDTTAKSKLNETLDSFKSLTAKEEFLRKIRINLIRRIAKIEKMDYIFLGSNATRLSIQLLTDVAQGRGSQIDSEICFIDNRDSSVTLLKPMREFTSKEITFYNRMNENKFVEIEELMTKKSAKSSIGKITEQFINYLQKDYPATTYTIGKIGYKLQNQNSKKRCSFCFSPIDEIDESKLSAQIALTITNSFNSSPKTTFNPDYCYGCNILQRETDKPDVLINKKES